MTTPEYWTERAEELMLRARDVFNERGRFLPVAVALVGCAPDGTRLDEPAPMAIPEIARMLQQLPDDAFVEVFREILSTCSASAVVLLLEAWHISLPEDADVEKVCEEWEGRAREHPDAKRALICTVDHLEWDGPVVYQAEVFTAGGRSITAGFEKVATVAFGTAARLLPRGEDA